MSCLVAIDGELVEGRDASISVFDRGFLYGDTIFETLRAYGGTVFRLADHLERLSWSAERMRMVLPWAAQTLAQEIERIADVARARFGTSELSLRLLVSRGLIPGEQRPSGLLPAATLRYGRTLFAQPFRPLPEALYRDGVTAISFATYRPSDSAGGAKVGNYGEGIRALVEASAQGAHEALIVSADGYVLEGATTNVFAVINDELLTPPASDTLLPGITRKCVLALAPSLLTVREQRLTPSRVAAAEEVFITSTLRELVPVVSIDGHRIGTGHPGARTLELAQRFRNAVLSELKQ
jgi:branched-chain amino acid aminotransferase